MSRIKLLLDLVNDVRSVADDLETLANALSSDEPESKENLKTEPAPTMETPAPEPAKTIRLEDVRAVLASKSREGYGDKVRELIRKHGGSKLSDIDPAEYSEMLKEAEGFGNAT